MLNFFSNWKTYILIISLLFNGLFYYQKYHAVNALQICNNNIAAVQAAINYANQVQVQQQQELEVKEQEIIKARKESIKRSEDISHIPIAPGCASARDFLRDFALGFHWDNNIP